MKHFTLFFLALIGFGFYTQAQSGVSLNPTDPVAVFNSLKSINKLQRDSLLNVIDTTNFETTPMAFDGPVSLSQELEKEIRSMVRDMAYAVRDYLKKPGQEDVIAAKLFDARIRIETVAAKVNYEMNVKELKDEFEQETYSNDTEKATAQKELDEEIAGEKKTMDEEIRSAKERGETDKQEFIKTLKSAQKA